MTGPAGRLRRIAATAARAATLIDAGALDRMGEWSGTGPNSGTGTSRGAISDPTAAAAITGPDLASRHAQAVTSAIDTALERLETAERILGLYRPAVVADDATRARLAALNGESPAPACRSCARIPGVGGVARWEPADARLRRPTDAGGVLDEPMWLCRWCSDTTRRIGRLPTTDELGRHHRGQRLRFAELPTPGRRWRR